MILEFELVRQRSNKGLKSYSVERKGLPVGRLHLVDDYELDGQIAKIEVNLK